MPFPSSGPPPFATETISGGGGGGGGGLTAEADQVLLVDDGNSGALFLRRYVKDDAGAVTSVVDTEPDGTTAYAVTGPVSVPAGTATGLTAESDPTVWYDPVADLYFVRSVEYNDDGTFSGYDDRNAAGASITPDASSYPSATALVGGPDATVTITRVTTANSPFSSTAGNLATHYIVIADAVTVEAVAVPANTGHTFEVPGRTVPAIDFTADATGDVLVIEEAA